MKDEETISVTFRCPVPLMRALDARVDGLRIRSRTQCLLLAVVDWLREGDNEARATASKGVGSTGGEGVREVGPPHRPRGTNQGR